MRKALHILKLVLLSLLALLLLACAGLALYLNHDALSARRRLDGIEDCAVPIDALALPDGVRVAALGEASHGNQEFQALRLTLLQKLVAQGYTAFALELDYGEGLLLNDYIQGGSGDGAALVRRLSTPVCRTEQTLALIEWMRAYNETVPEAGRLRFYGVDMQNGEASAARLLSYCDALLLPDLGPDLAKIETLAVPSALDQTAAAEINQSLVRVSAALEAAPGADAERGLVLQAARALMQAMGTYEIHGEEAYYSYRDRCMADNVLWILDREQTHGGGKLLLAAHNSHISRRDPSLPDNMGLFLSEALGDAYYSIGTDFFTARVNISTSSMMTDRYERADHRFCSADPLAYQAKYLGGSYYLDFAAVDESRPVLYRELHSPIPMAQLGEGYLWLWYLFPNQYRPAKIPADLYDGMICFYHATPIRVLS